MITAGHTQGMHLWAAFLPAEGGVLLQIQVERKENEIHAAPQLLRMLELRGKIISGDALLAQRDLSRVIVPAVAGMSGR